MILIAREPYAFVIFAFSAGITLTCALLCLSIWQRAKIKVFLPAALAAFGLCLPATSYALLQLERSALPTEPAVLAARLGWLIFDFALPWAMILILLGLDYRVPGLRKMLTFWRGVRVLLVLVVAYFLVMGK